MAKTSKNDISSKLGDLKSFMQSKDDVTPIQKVVLEHPTSKDIIEETKFTVHIPTPLMDTIRDIGHFNKKKLKTIFIEALQEYAEKHK